MKKAPPLIATVLCLNTKGNLLELKETRKSPLFIIKGKSLKVSPNVHVNWKSLELTTFYPLCMKKLRFQWCGNWKRLFFHSRCHDLREVKTSQKIMAQNQPLTRQKSIQRVQYIIYSCTVLFFATLVGDSVPPEHRRNVSCIVQLQAAWLSMAAWAGWHFSQCFIMNP